MIKLVLIVTTLFIINGCSKAERHADGTVDSGGGNGFDRKVLESYRYSVLDSPESEEVLEILNNVGVVSSDLASIMYSTFLLKPWYLVPVDLRNLTPQTIGVQFNSDQMALHYIGEIWLSQLSWSKMSRQEKTSLLIHEALMGARLYKYRSERERCWSKSFLIGDKLDSPGFLKRKMGCEIYRWADLAKEYQGQFLSTSEYQAIRELTSATTTKKGLLSEIEFEKLSDFLIIKNASQSSDQEKSSSEIGVEPL